MLSEHLSERKNFKIGEVAKMFKVNASLLRFWEREFVQLKPLKTRGGERVYRKEHIEIIAQIYELTKVKGYTLDGAKEVLQTQKSRLEFQIDMTQRLTKIKSLLEELRSNLDEV